MRRRRLIQLGGAVVGTAVVPGLAAGRDEGGSPNGAVSESSVHVFSTEDDPIEVPASGWVRHYIGWVDDGTQREADVRAVLDAWDSRAWIDGEEIDDLDDYWSDPVEEDGKWYAWWEYYTPPRSKGRHTFRFANTVTETVDTGDRVYEAGSGFDLTGYYDVVGGNGGASGDER